MKTSLKILIVLLSFYPRINLLSQNNPILPPGSYKIYPDSLNITNEMSVSDFLQGRVSGLDIIASSGDPGRNAEIVLRGLNNSGINSPLIVIDGIPWLPLSEFLIPLTLNDIASIEILKDGSAASIYGAEGANGVILIETKKGGSHRMRLSYQFNRSLVKEPSFMPMLDRDEFIMYQLEAYHNSGVIDIPPEIAYDRDFAGFYNYSANTDWVKAVTRPGNASNQLLNISGGNKKNHYYGSLNYLDQKGTLINSRYKQFSSRIFLEHYLTDKLTLSLQLSNACNKYDGNLSFDGRNILEMAFIKAPNMSIMEYDSMGTLTGDYFVPNNNYQGSGLNYYNPVAISELGKSENTQNSFVTTGRVKYTFNEWLSFVESLSYLRSSAIYDSYLPGKAISSDWVYASLPVIDFESGRVSDQFRNEIRALYKIPFKNGKRHTLNGTVTWIRQHLKNKTQYADDQFKSDWNRNAAVSSLQYRFLNRYILNVHSRFESVFYDSQLWDKHFGFSGGWNFSDEPWLKGFHLLNNGIIHAGWSHLKYHPFEFYGTLIPWYEDEIHSQTFNSGIQLGIFSNRIQFAADYYNKSSWEEVTTPASIPELESSGWEVMVDYGFIKTRNFRMGINFNIAHNNSILKELPGISIWGMPVNGVYLNKLTKNKSLGSIYGFIYEGLYATDQDAVARDREGNILYDNMGQPRMMSYEYHMTYQTFQGGDVKYKDVNYDGVINDEDVVYLGSTYPEYTGGFGTSLKFKNLSIESNFHFRSGYKVIRQAFLESEGMVFNHNQSKEVLNRWRIQGQGTDLNHRACIDHPANDLGSDNYLGNGSFIRMNYVKLGYDINPVICQKLHLSEISLSLSAQRLITFTDYDGIDPEIEMDSYGKHRDVIRAYPPKIYTFSIRVVL